MLASAFCATVNVHVGQSTNINGMCTTTFDLQNCKKSLKLLWTFHHFGEREGAREGKGAHTLAAKVLYSAVSIAQDFFRREPPLHLPIGTANCQLHGVMPRCNHAPPPPPPFDPPSQNATIILKGHMQT